MGDILCYGRKSECFCWLSLVLEEIPDFWDHYAAVGRCGKYHFPQELSGTVDRTEFTATRKGQAQLVVKETPVCKKCADKVGGD